MKIYIVELHDYDRNDSVGYFTDRNKAEKCCIYLNMTDPSDYNDHFEWTIAEFDLNEIDYESQIKEIEEQERIEFETRMERIKQEELAKLAELKAKYEMKTIPNDIPKCQHEWVYIGLDEYRCAKCKARKYT